MSDKPLVTIGLPVYNSETYLRQSIESLLAQTYSDFVLVISDNASTDGTADICHSCAKKDSRIRYYRNDENIGNPRNFNRIAKLTETRYLKWSTSDDYCDPTFVEKALAVMEQDPSIILCYPKTTLIDGDGQNPRPYEDNLHLMQDDPSERFREPFLRSGLAHQHLGLIRVSLLRQTHLLRTHVASDYNLHAEMALHGKFYELPERLFYRRFHPTSGSWKRGDSKHQAKYYLAAKQKNQSFKNWRALHADFASVLSAPIPVSKKLKLFAWLSMRFVRQSRGLLLEVVDYARSKVA
jgi:glycosyltransferase involved in cell wall biosynthesis